MQAFLEKFRSKESVNKSVGSDIFIGGRRKLLPPSEMTGVLDTLQLYQDERNSCQRYRLTFQVNTLCTNVLNNSITEIVGNEGSDDVYLLNYGDKGNLVGKKIDEVLYKSTNLSTWKTLEAIRDTQLSGYLTYHCGKDIFNNHLLRSKTFKSICQIDTNDKDNSIDYSDFNTLSDTMRTWNGKAIIDDIMYPASANITGGRLKKRLHVYTYDDISSYDTTLETKLHKTFNGWFGFYNGAKINTFCDNKDKCNGLNINRTLLNYNAGDFIDMYPGRDLYNFVPKFNPYKNRIEKNWEYCITYPSSSTIKGIDFLGQGKEDGYCKGAIKIVLFDENTKSDNGSGQINFYSSAKHGLTEGDRVNIYNGEELIIPSVEVKKVFDSYIFITENNNTLIGKQWVQINDLNRTEYNITNNGSTVKRKLDGKEYRIVNKRVNLDDSSLNISFKKVNYGIECDYYVRIFSRVPNFRFAETSASEEDIYKDNGRLIKEYQKPQYDFESHCSKLAFAKNVYSDQIGEIVYTDDIDINGLKDNLGRPLTSIYLTILKNNSGYKYWYGSYGKDLNILHGSIEYSHCFGKLSAQFHKSEDAIKFNYVGITNVNNVDVTKKNELIKAGLPIKNINDRGKNPITEYDEIDVKNDIHFYGDFVCYDNHSCTEQVIDDALFRFNTAQRELVENRDKAYEYFKEYSYEEIVSDDYDLKDNGNLGNYSNSFGVEKKTKEKACQKKEGYYYKPHYEIKLRSFGKLQELYPEILRIRTLVTNNDECTFKTLQEHGLKQGDNIILYDVDKRIIYRGIVKQIMDNNIFSCIFYKEEDGKQIKVTNNEIPIITGGDSRLKMRYRLFNVSNLLIPSYYTIAKDGSCAVRWREVIQNGFENNSDNSINPFTNGAIYINTPINLKLRRQDPFDIFGMWASQAPYDPAGSVISDEDKNNYVKADDIVC
jgi:hypothetical protein